MLQTVVSQVMRVAKTGAAGIVALAALSALALPAQARGPQGGSAPEADSAPIALAELPVQGRTTYARIREGGPFPYDKDGTVFGNRERLLPRQSRGYWLEYTVKTPGVRHRGARRIVCGGPATVPDVCYYTQDHYASFRKIVP